MDYDLQGRVTGGRRRLAGRNYAFTLDAHPRYRQAVACATFTTDEIVVARLTAAMSVTDEDVSLTLDDRPSGPADEVPQMTWRLDFSNYDQDHVGHAELVTRDLGTLRGIYDPRRERSSLQLAVDAWLNDEQRVAFNALRPAFMAMRRRFDPDAAQYDEVISRTIRNSVWRTAGRAACWGFAGMGSAAAGLGLSLVITPGGGAIVAAGVFGAAASVCNDLVSQNVN